MDALKRNLIILDDIQKNSGAKILLALKGFATQATFPLINKYLKGICASSLHEAMFGKKHFGSEVHTFSPSFRTDRFEKIENISDYLIFNSISQWNKYKDHCSPNTKCGIRINPENSESGTKIYDPCSPDSRLGIKKNMVTDLDLKKISGAHFHNLCQNGVDSLERTLKVVEENFSSLLHHIEWLNIGGGHFLTHPKYNLKKLIELLSTFQKKYDLQIYMEPGEAVVWQTGILYSTVLDIIPGEKSNVILDTSVTCHMPDVLEMPYRPEIEKAGKENEYKHNYILGGTSCLAGDTLGLYSFKDKLTVDQHIEINDMSQYTMVKSSTFNGINLPSIVLVSNGGKRQEIVKTFGYEDFESRLV
jgi:carboxynorspermidine decarboxylase